MRPPKRVPIPGRPSLGAEKQPELVRALLVQFLSDYAKSLIAGGLQGRFDFPDFRRPLRYSMARPDLVSWRTLFPDPDRKSTLMAPRYPRGSALSPPCIPHRRALPTDLASAPQSAIAFIGSREFEFQS